MSYFIIASNKWHKTGTQKPGKKTKLSEVQPIIREKLTVDYESMCNFNQENQMYFSFRLKSVNLNLKMSQDDLKMTDNQLRPIFAIFCDPWGGQEVRKYPINPGGIGGTSPPP